MITPIVMEASRNSTSSHRYNQSAIPSLPNATQNAPDDINIAQSIRTRSADTSSTGSDEAESSTDFPEGPVRGWPQLALLMAKHPDLASFSRFRELNLKSLSYYQAELMILKKELHRQEHMDAAGGNLYAEYIDDIVRDKNSPQFQIVAEIRKVLKEYNEALLQFSQISALPGPDPYNVRTLRRWMRHKECGNFCVRGDGQVWGDIYQDPDAGRPTLWRQFATVLWTLISSPPPLTDNLDLVATTPRRKIDRFTQWFAWQYLPFAVALRKYRKQKHIQSDEEKASRGQGFTRQEYRMGKMREVHTLETWSRINIVRFVSGFSLIVACLPPIAAIAVLSQVHGTRNLLLCVTGFTMIFAWSLISQSEGTPSRSEIFTATSAFAAVMVVFISTPVIVFPSNPPSPSPSPPPSLRPTS